MGSEFVRIVGCFRGPENEGVIPLNAAQLHGKRGARLCKLRYKSLKRGLIASGPFKGPLGANSMHPIRSLPLRRRRRSQQTISDDDPEPR